MAKKSIRVESLDRLVAQMQRGEACIEPSDVNPVLVKALDLVHQRAMQNLQSGPGYERLAAFQYPGQRHISDVMATAPTKSSKFAGAWLKVWRKFAPQAIWLEFGHRVVGHKPRLTDTGKRVSPRPFFRPAISSEMSNVKQSISDGIRDLIARGVGIGR